MGRNSVRKPTVVTGSVLLRGEGVGRRPGPRAAKGRVEAPPAKATRTDSQEAALWDEKAEVFRALGQPVRLRIVEALARKEHAVTQLEHVTGARQPNLSKHLALLRRAGLIERRKDGLNVFYRLKLRCVGNFLSCVEEALKERLVETRSLLSRL